MFYLSQMLGKPVVDADGQEIGHISDVGIETREIFPRVTSLGFIGPDKTPFMLSWRKYVDSITEDQVALNVASPKLRFSYLQPDEVLLARDLMSKQIVDTRGKNVVRVNDLKLSETKGELRLLGAEVGIRGILRGLSPALERAVQMIVRIPGGTLHEKLIAWNYMELLDRDLTHVTLSVTHKRLHELHPADVADVLEQLTPSHRAKVFAHLDNTLAAEAIAELEDEYQAQAIDEFSAQRASDILEIMDPDDAADIIADLPYETAESLLKLMGLREAHLVRQLLGYREESAGGIMTSEITAVTDEMTITEVVDYLRHEAPTGEDVYYIYVVDKDRTLQGVINLRDLIVRPPDTPVSEIVDRDVLSVNVDDDQEDVVEVMSKYDLLAIPVIDESGKILGIVTVDDALKVLEEESAEDLALATGSRRKFGATGAWSWLARRSGWLTVWTVLGAGAAVLAILFLPLILRLSEDVATHSLAILIESGDPDERPSFGRQLAVDTGAGIALGLISGLIVFGLVEAFGETHLLAATLAIATGVTVVVAAMASALIPWIALVVGRARHAPSTLITTTVSLLGLAIYLLLAVYLQDALVF